jgi:small subunit ribosomal protein S3
MGQKINPLGFRLGVIEPWRSRWYAKKKDYSRFLLQDHKIRQYVLKEFKAAGIPKVEIERTGEAVNVVVHTARPGVLVGRKGVRVDQLKTDLQRICGMTCHLTVKEIKRPELESTLVAEMVAESLEKRMAFRRAMKKALQTAIQAGAKGCKVEINGRLGGAEMAREAKEREGQVPLSTLRANIDYGTANANTTAGVIGVKVWIYKGDLEPGEKLDAKTGAGTRSNERDRGPSAGRPRPPRPPREPRTGAPRGPSARE